jgi:hypothetical protein
MTIKFDRDSVDNHQIRRLLTQAVLSGNDSLAEDCMAAVDLGDCAAAERCIDHIERAYDLGR